MQLYDCIVRLNGAHFNEVRKTDVTAAEIAVLRAIHQSPEAGIEAVHSIVPKGQVNRDDDEERARLQQNYGAGLANNERLKTLNNILGHDTVPLPKTVKGVDSLPAPKGGKRVKVPEAPVEPELPLNPGDFS